MRIGFYKLHCKIVSYSLFDDDRYHDRYITSLLVEITIFAKSDTNMILTELATSFSAPHLKRERYDYHILYLHCFDEKESEFNVRKMSDKILH